MAGTVDVLKGIGFLKVRRFSLRPKFRCRENGGMLANHR